jgi:hypothetical protein
MYLFPFNSLSGNKVRAWKLASVKMIPTNRIQSLIHPYYPYRDTFAVNVLENYKFTELVGDEIKVC